MKRTVRVLASGIMLALLPVLIGACSKAYYGAMEKVGYHKRDIMVDRVEQARNAQEDAQEQFRSALEQFDAVVTLQETDLNKAYERLDGEYRDCVAVADSVSARIDKVDSVSKALFDEWEDEIDLYRNRDLARSSKKQLADTRARYDTMMDHMRAAEASMEPVLALLRDNVLFLKHNLNAQAIGSLQREFAGLETEIDALVERMSEAIASSNAFIEQMQGA